MGKVTRMFADAKYHNYKLYEWVEEHASWDLEIVRGPEGKKGWVKLPIRWTVERTFAWLCRCRRLNLDREKSVLSSESFIKLAMIQMMAHRLEHGQDRPRVRLSQKGGLKPTYGTDAEPAAATDRPGGPRAAIRRRSRTRPCTMTPHYGTQRIRLYRTGARTAVARVHEERDPSARKAGPAPAPAPGKMATIGTAAHPGSTA